MSRNALQRVEPEDSDDEEDVQVAIDPRETDLFDKIRDLDYDDILLVSGTLDGKDALFIAINHARDLEHDEPQYEALYARLTPEQARRVSFGEDEEQPGDVDAEAVREVPSKPKRASRGRGK